MPKPTLLIGGEGNIGRRYQAIYKSLGIPFSVWDLPNLGSELPRHFDNYVICSPTETHLGYVRYLINLGKRFICEKPLATNPITEDLGYKNGFMVCNYLFMTRGLNAPRIFYDYYNTGRDGMFWDACQLLYLNPKAIIRNKSPIWKLKINRRLIPYAELERSYLRMIRAFEGNRDRFLWTLEDGIKMTDTVIRRMG